MDIIKPAYHCIKLFLALLEPVNYHCYFTVIKRRGKKRRSPRQSNKIDLIEIEKQINRLES